MGFGTQRLWPSLLEGTLPSAHRRRRGANQTRYLSNTFALLEHVAADPATNFQCFCTTFGSHKTTIIPLFLWQRECQ